jgi:hypothetical protein
LLDEGCGGGFTRRHSDISMFFIPCYQFLYIPNLWMLE